jgi:hypothetical protein
LSTLDDDDNDDDNNNNNNNNNNMGDVKNSRSLNVTFPASLTFGHNAAEQIQNSTNPI